MQIKYLSLKNKLVPTDFYKKFLLLKTKLKKHYKLAKEDAQEHLLSYLVNDSQQIITNNLKSLYLILIEFKKLPNLKIKPSFNIQ